MVIPIEILLSDQHSAPYKKWRTFHKSMLRWPLENVSMEVISPRDIIGNALKSQCLRYQSEQQCKGKICRFFGEQYFAPESRWPT